MVFKKFRAKKQKSMYGLSSESLKIVAAAMAAEEATRHPADTDQDIRNRAAERVRKQLGLDGEQGKLVAHMMVGMIRRGDIQ